MTIQASSLDFLRHCRYEKNLSEKTLTAYSTDLRQFATFLQSHELPLLLQNITKVELRSYLESIAHLKSKSIKRKIATLKALFNYLEFEDRITVNPFRKMRIRIRDSKKLPVVMTVAEITKLLTLLYKRKEKVKEVSRYAYTEAVRNIAIVELLFTTGARVSEIANLKSDCIDLKNGHLTIKGKGNKERVLSICHPETLSILREYRSLQQVGTKDYFFINREGRKTSDQSIRNLVKKLAATAGFSKRITPHVFRHSFATLLLEKDVDIKYIQSLLGHSSIITTQIYTHVSRSKQKQILRTRHPRKDLTMIVS